MSEPQERITITIPPLPATQSRRPDTHPLTVPAQSQSPSQPRHCAPHTAQSCRPPAGPSNLRPDHPRPLKPSLPYPASRPRYRLPAHASLFFVDLPGPKIVAGPQSPGTGRGCPSHKPGSFTARTRPDGSLLAVCVVKDGRR
ncbi:uncharacterized protein K452DRAFT_137892 [Aplosporella prunicola CBS 121167]|uniref:Uncharacterized protein n=1 Tax=Aplosporella prunicola CBS 121167 TaxID=1176127 RepID=A0A6A6AXN9_9PEZI|nr:uncharacterized protein K452DRAFT_137892 [Aplosporella prunicola CBS 121167]KAF2136376.1 hypothetical protein K452DRAFT_137892 [Aplosporella prunicola CBS 121167]